MVARYRLAERCFIKVDHSQEACLHEKGTEFEYSGNPSRNFIPLNDEADAAMAALAPLTAMAGNILPRRGDPAP